MQRRWFGVKWHGVFGCRYVLWVSIAFGVQLASRYSFLPKYYPVSFHLRCAKFSMSALWYPRTRGRQASRNLNGTWWRFHVPAACTAGSGTTLFFSSPGGTVFRPDRQVREPGSRFRSRKPGPPASRWRKIAGRARWGDPSPHTRFLIFVRWLLGGRILTVGLVLFLCAHLVSLCGPASGLTVGSAGGFISSRLRILLVRRAWNRRKGTWSGIWVLGTGDRGDGISAQGAGTENRRWER